MRFLTPVPLIYGRRRTIAIVVLGEAQDRVGGDRERPGIRRCEPEIPHVRVLASALTEACGRFRGLLSTVAAHPIPAGIVAGIERTRVASVAEPARVRVGLRGIVHRRANVILVRCTVAVAVH